MSAKECDMSKVSSDGHAEKECEVRKVETRNSSEDVT